MSSAHRREYGKANVLHLWLKLTLLTLILSLAHCKPTNEQPANSSSVGMYTAVGPKLISPHSTYNISIFVEPRTSEATVPLQFHASLLSLKENYTDSETVTILPGQTGFISIPTRELTTNRYNLTLKVKDGSQEIQDSTTLFPKEKDETVILIHTDKPMYKPGETVRFRVVLLNGDVKPFPTTSDSDENQVNALLDVKIFDPEGNTIKIWENVKLNTGLFSEKLELSTEPVMGDWNIEVKPKIKLAVVNSETAPGNSTVSLGKQAKGLIRPIRPKPVNTDQRKTQKFTVAQYVLPKFQVTVKPPPFITFNQTTIPVEIQAKYTYGKAVAGECTITPKRSYYNNDEKLISTTFPIDGSIVKEIDIKHLFADNQQWEQEISFEAQVTETVTGKSQNGTGKVQIYKYPYKIDQIVKTEYVKPGLPFNIIFKILTQDNMPISDPAPNALKISHGFSWDAKFGTMETSIPANGLVNLTFETPTNELLQVSRIDVTYKDLTHNYYVPQKYNSDTSSYINIKLLGANGEADPLIDPIFKVDSKITINVNSTKPFSSLNYLIHGGRQEIFEYKKVNLPSPVMDYNLEIICPAKAPPEARVIVYVVNDQNELIVDSLKFTAKKLDQDFDNFLNINILNGDTPVTSTSTFEPGQNISLQLKSKSNSLIALRGVDQSVLLLKEQDVDITQTAVDDQVKSNNDEFMNFHRIWGGSSAFQVFELGGLTLLTNTKVQIEREQPEVLYSTTAAAFGAPVAAVAFEQADFAPKRVANLAFSPSRGFSSGGEIRVRTEFPETWLWEEVSLNDSNTLDFHKTVPDTLTSWIITGYSLNTDSGLGILPQSQKVTVFRPFFISLNLPYSVVKGEVLVLQVLVHNYLPSEGNTSAEITLDNSKHQFQFNDKSLQDASQHTKTVSCPPNAVTSVSFVIVPTEFGSIMLNVKGVTHMAGDALSQPLRVKPPGHQERRTASALIRTVRAAEDKDAATEMTVNLTTAFPDKRVPGADTVKMSFISDILGSTIANLDKMLQIPVGCGEQNMLNFVADIVILDYLKHTYNLDEKVKAKAVQYLETGYQRELTYRHYDGSFSAFGSSDGQGSTWLTAFVVRSFIQAKPYITVDDNLILSALEFLSQKQFENGAVYENGKVLHSEMQGGSYSSGVALTAYSALAFIEASQNWNKPKDANSEPVEPNSEPKKPAYAANVKNALDFITSPNQTRDSNNEDDLYAIVLTTYALHLANHPQKDKYFEKMQGLATRSGGLTFWERKVNPNKTKILNETEHYPWEIVTRPVSVEMTGYALLTYILRGEVADSFPLVKWLLKERNSNGGFHSTQDTVVGLTALAKYAELTKDNVTNLQVKATYNAGDRAITIDKSNAEILQEFELPNDTSSIQVAASGVGTVLAQLTWRYYVEDEVREPAFAVEVKTSTKSTGELLLNISTSYLRGNASNMAIIEVNLPSGYTIDKDSLGELQQVTGYKRFDTDNGDTKLDIYMDSINSNKISVPVTALRSFKVGKQAPAFVRVYDYYDPTQTARVFYEAPAVSICDICQENNDCEGNNCL